MRLQYSKPFNYTNKTISVESLELFTCMQNRIIGITLQYIEQFDHVQMNEFC